MLALFFKSIAVKDSNETEDLAILDDLFRFIPRIPSC